jgi:hypothetical protein
MSLKNGQISASVAESTNASTIRTRRYRDRKRRGAVYLQSVIEPDLIACLSSLGWLHVSERNNREAVTAAIGALVLRSLSAGMTPSPTKATLEIDLEAIRDALPWLRPETPINSQSAAKALETVARCSATVGFSPAEYSTRLMRMVERRAH